MLLFRLLFLAQHRRYLPLLLAGMLVLALAPVLGQMHRVLHNVHGLQGLADLPSVSSAQQGQWSALFTSHERADCLLLDAVSLGDGHSGSSLPMPVYALPTAAPLAHIALCLGAEPLWAFQARAPPLRY